MHRICTPRTIIKLVGVRYIHNTHEEYDFSKIRLSNDLMFSSVMRDKEFCKPFLETILGIMIKDIRYPKYQKTIDVSLRAKSIRLDIYVDDDEGTIYNVEMQRIGNRDIPRRSRYYQSLIDINVLEKGEKYHKLPKSLVIFICMEDYFGLDMPIYRFRNICIDKPDLQLDDGTEKIFVNIQTTKMLQLTPKQ